MKSEHLPQAADSSEINQWDPGMRASMRVCLVDLWDRLEFFYGYEINKRPNEADLVIIKKTGAGRLDDIVAEFFADVNVIEFKSPGDHLGIEELYTVKGYAAMIVGNGFQGSHVHPGSVTITLVREERPDAVIRYLKSLDLGYEAPYPGVYRFTGGGIFPIQILAYGEMEDDRWLILRSMTRKMTQEMRGAVRDALSQFRAPGDREVLVETIVHTYFKANRKLFEEGDPMYEWLEPVYRPKMDRIAAESMALGEARGIALGEARGMALGEARGIALGEARGIALGEARGMEQGVLSTLFGLVRKGRLTVAEASAEADMALPLFQAKMAEYEARPHA